MKYVWVILFLICSQSIYSISDTLFIVKQNTSVGFTDAFFCSFLHDDTFSKTNALLQINSNDTLNLVIHNLDTLEHTFTIDNVIESANIIPASGTLSIQILPLLEGTYRFYSSSSFGQYLGASGILQVGYEGYLKYGWNFYDLDVGFSDSLAMNQTEEISSDYLPTYFLINGNSYPESISDISTSISGMLNDTIIISMVNSGNMANSFHFHGYHVTILNSNKDNSQIGWSKDSVPIRQGEGITLRLVAHQSGTYPVHAHNLIATTSSGIYPGGMICLINISP